MRRALDVPLGAVAPVQHDGRRAAGFGRARDHDARARDHAPDVARKLALDVVAIERAIERRADLLESLQPLEGAGPHRVAHAQNRQTLNKSTPNCRGVGAKPRALALLVQSTALVGGSIPPDSVSTEVSW